MSTFIDKKFINLVSCQLERFSWKKENLANCRCPICGDSAKNKVKARGFFFEKQGEYFYKCHNCNIGLNLYNFLDKISPSLTKEYTLEKWKDGKPNKIKKGNSSNMVFKKKPKKTYSIDLPTVAELPPNHMCRQFVELRKIPKDMWGNLYYAEDFSVWAKRINPESSEGLASEPRLVIPILDRKGNLVGAQGRVFKASSDHSSRRTMRYITIKPEEQKHKSWYGLDRLQLGTVYVVEGPLDSLFIPNCLATVGMSDVFNVPNEIKDRSVIYVLDNEPRNTEVVRTMEKLIEQHKRICVWPTSMKYKDINDMILAGYETKEIINMINKNAVSGLEAQIRINKWKKI